MIFLELHSFTNDEKMIYINISKISDFTNYLQDEGSLITMENGDRWAVQETPQQIKEIINKAGRMSDVY